jgi:hypothetical protein
MIEKARGAGGREFIPVRFARSVVEPGEGKRKRIEKIALAAAKQSGAPVMKISPERRSRSSRRRVARVAGRDGAAARRRRLRGDRPRGRPDGGGGGAFRPALLAGSDDPADRDRGGRGGVAAPLMKKLAAFDLVILGYIAIVTAIVLAFRPPRDARLPRLPRGGGRARRAPRSLR